MPGGRQFVRGRLRKTDPRYAGADVPVFVGGGIATGKMAAHMFLMDTAGVQMGTRFAVTEESTAHPRFKERFLKAKAREAVATPQYDSRLHVVAVRAIKNKAHDNFGKLQLEKCDAPCVGLIERGFHGQNQSFL
jgi:NAD(P)H-dependent flavin oxidoreductase YrpB (nitropropane dioxygenase family)